jgi:hypothetical protein
MTNVVRWGGLKAARRLSKSVPVIGTVIAVATIGRTMRRKGLLRGALDAGLTATPFLGAAKLAYESVLGRDLFPDRTRARPDRSSEAGRVRQDVEPPASAPARVDPGRPPAENGPP